METSQLPEQQPLTEASTQQPDLVPVVAESHKSFSPVVLLGVTVLVFAVGVAGYYLGTQKSTTVVLPSASPISSPNLTNNEPATTSILIENNALDATANWETYSIKELNLEFKLPASFAKNGTWKTSVYPGELGMQLCATFVKETSFILNIVYAGGGACEGNKFGVGATSSDFSAGREGGFSDSQGFILKEGKYFAKAPLNHEYVVPNNLVTKVPNNTRAEVIKVMGANYYSEVVAREMPEAGTPGKGKIGALVNTKNITYPGFSIEMELSEDITEAVFDQILSTIVIK